MTPFPRTLNSNFPNIIILSVKKNSELKLRFSASRLLKTSEKILHIQNIKHTYNTPTQAQPASHRTREIKFTLGRINAVSKKVKKA